MKKILLTLLLLPLLCLGGGVSHINNAILESINIPDNGTGTKASYTLDPDHADLVILANLDTQGADVSMGETKAWSGRLLYIFVSGSISVSFADQSGVLALRGATLNLVPGDALALVYSNDQWWELEFADSNADASHDEVTLSGTPDYITISGQNITRNTIDIADLSFDPATQTELNTHAGTSAAHHTRPSAGTGLAEVANAFNVTLGTSISIGELDFDPFTQAEYNIHSGTADAHHARPTAGTGLTEAAGAFNVNLGTTIEEGELSFGVTTDAELASHAGTAGAHHPAVTMSESADYASFNPSTQVFAFSTVNLGSEVEGLLGVGNITNLVTLDSELASHTSTSSAHHTKPTAGTGLTDSSGTWSVNLGTSIQTLEIDTSNAASSGKILGYNGSSLTWVTDATGSGGAWVPYNLSSTTHNCGDDNEMIYSAYGGGSATNYVNLDSSPATGQSVIARRESGNYLAIMQGGTALRVMNASGAYVWYVWDGSSWLLMMLGSGS